MLKKVSTYLDGDLFDALNRYAAAQHHEDGVKLSVAVRMLVREGLKRKNLLDPPEEND